MNLRAFKIPGGTWFLLGDKLRTVGIWLSWSKPIWWEPRFLHDPKYRIDCGMGWLMLAVRFTVVNCKYARRDEIE